MATILATMSGVMGSGAPVYAATAKAAQKITSSASSQQLTMQADGNEYVNITTTGGPIAILIGPNPTVVAGAAGTHYIADGQSKDFGPMKTGDKIAVIDA